MRSGETRAQRYGPYQRRNHDPVRADGRPGKAVIEELARRGLKRGENGLKIIMMCEIPSNALLAEQFLEYFDGFSIGSNDMTQLALGLDRDSGVVSELFDERNDAVKALLSMAIRAAKNRANMLEFVVRVRPTMKTLPLADGRGSTACR